MQKQFEHQWKTQQADGSTIFRTCAWSPPGDHPVGCGVELTVKDGKLIHVEGDESMPITQGRLCPRCLALKDYTYHPDRIIYPMKRDRADRGKADKWQRITWDEAYDLIEEKVKDIKAKYGAESIVVYGGTGREACMFYYPMAFSVLNTPNLCYSQSGWSCYGPRCSVADYILGAGYPEIDNAAFYPDRYDNPNYELPKYVVLWGKMPLWSNGDGFFGHSLIDMMKLGTKIICIDPRVTWLGARKGNITLQLKPQTDAALALGLLNVIINEDLYDHDFVQNWCFGFDELAERCNEYPPEVVEKYTWVPAEDIRYVARLIAQNRPMAIAWGLALDQSNNGVQAAHAVIALEAITGNIDVPGGLTVGDPSVRIGHWCTDSRAYLSDELWEKRIGVAKWPAFAATMASTMPDETLDQLESGNPYAIKMAWFNSSNLLSPTCSAQPQRWLKALQPMEFSVGQDLFMNPTIEALCDVFLPMSTFAEHDGIVIPYYMSNNIFTGCMAKALSTGDTRSDLEICWELGRRIVPEAWAKYNNVEEWLDEQLVPEYGFTFAEFKEKGVHFPGNVYKKYEKGMLRNDGEPGFNTVTGLVELFSTLYDAWLEDPLPYFEEPRYSQVSKPELAEEYPLMATSGARVSASFHSEHRQIPRLRALNPDPYVEINPVTAAKYGIKDGDWVQVYNMLGKGNWRAQLVQTIDERVVHCQHGWWFPEQDGNYPNLYGVFKSNFNQLVPHFEVGNLGFGAPFKGVMANIRKVDNQDSEL
ncbi:MAG: molybdopterin-dependent oxidoreductase [Coriobacteriales bacterium]|jgi:anaerobic selenocysteine-containing dehydrogenase|nr:molybdopterin-dependent oxidoreductase [Coriobacteriales bacterium]